MRGVRMTKEVQDTMQRMIGDIIEAHQAFTLTLENGDLIYDACDELSALIDSIIIEEEEK